jgi:hypothetical protein
MKLIGTGPTITLLIIPKLKKRLILVLDSATTTDMNLFTSMAFLYYSLRSVDKEPSNTAVLACLESDSGGVFKEANTTISVSFKNIVCHRVVMGTSWW